MGFVFGYQNRGQFYLFDWKQADQNDPLGFAAAGMNIKAVDTGGGDPTGHDLWPSVGSPKTRILRQNTVVWDDFTDCSFRLNFTPGLFEVEVKQGSTVREDWVVADNAYGSGVFGFYNYSQSDVRYVGFTFDDAPRPIGVPDPGATSLLAALGALGLMAMRKGLQ
jgi:hypothetical protein